MMSTHSWCKNLLAMPKGKPPVHWFPKCRSCGSQAAIVGGKLFFRKSANHEWCEEQPACSPTGSNTNE